MCKINWLNVTCLLFFSICRQPDNPTTRQVLGINFTECPATYEFCCKVVTDHSALKFLQTADMPSGKRAHWIMYLQQFKFEIVHRPGKENKNADALSRIPEVQCFFTGVKNQGGEGSSEENFSEDASEINILGQIEPEGDGYEGESEDNAEKGEFFEEEMEQIRKEMKEIEQLKEQREERWKNLRQDIEKVKESVSEILERTTIRGRTITILTNNGSDDETDHEENEIEDVDEVAQENEQFYSENHA